jgi:predicted DNA-binding transcriptional regulator YafY
VGRRSPTESIARIFAAFLRQRTWSQAALAREVEIGVPALRKRLDEIAAHGVPLETESDPPHVYWSVPANWFPDSVAFSRNEVPDLLHVLRHAPRSRRRDKLLQVVFDTRRDRTALAATESVIITPVTSEAAEAFLPTIEDSIAQRRPVRMRFYSTERGVVETRHASVHRVDVGPPTRLIATCHRADRLKWFRVDNIVEVHVDREAAFRDASEDAIRRFCADSIDGFRGEGAPEEHVFFVREPEARWVTKNLLPPMRAEAVEGGVRITVTTAGAMRVARYVVGLGAAARVETAHLGGLVEELARGALRRGAQPRKLAKTRETSAERARRRANR